jgi:hypothetical protein
MVDLLAATSVLALLVAGGCTIIAAVLGRLRLAIVFAATGFGGFAILFGAIVALIIPTVEERIGFLGAIAAFVGLATMSIPYLVIVLSKTEPTWADPLMRAGKLLAVGGLGGMAIFDLTSLQRPG